MEVGMNKQMSLFNINCLHFSFKLLYNINNMFSRRMITEYLPLDDRKALVHYFTLCLVGIRYLTCQGIRVTSRQIVFSGISFLKPEINMYIVYVYHLLFR